MSIVHNNGSVLYPPTLLAATGHIQRDFNMPQGVRGKARKISDEIIIDSDDALAVVVDDNRGTKEPPAAPESPEKNLALDVDSDSELSDDSLPATVSNGKPPGKRGIKRKISALVPRKQTPAERTY